MYQNDFAILSSGSRNPFAFRTYVGDAILHPRVQTVLYNKQKFKIRLLPSITEISSHSGSSAGGQIIEIKGRAWQTQEQNEQIKFLINGDIQCKEINDSLKFDPQTSLFSAKCQITVGQHQSTKFATQSFIGGQGWLHTLYLGQNNFSNLIQNNNVIQDLHFNAQIPQDNVRAGNNEHISRSQTFFKAPKTGYYYFWAKSSHQLKLYLNSQQNKIPDSWNQDVDLILNLNQGKSHYFIGWDGQNFSTKSKKVQLQKGQFYYMEMLHHSQRNSQFASIGVQIQQTKEHPKNLPEIQRIGFEFTPKLDQYSFKIEWGNTDEYKDKSFKIKFKYYDQGDGEWKNKYINDIPANSSPQQFKAKVSEYFDSHITSKEFVVQKIFYQDDGVTHTNEIDDVYYIEYKIHMKEFTTTPREQQDHYPEIDYEFYEQHASFKPGQPGLNGEWGLLLYSPDGNPKEVNGLSYQIPAEQLQSLIWNLVPDYKNRLEITERSEIKADNFQKSFAGCAYIFAFTEYRVNIPQFKTIEQTLQYGSQNEYPTMISQTIQEFSNDYFFAPAPYQFFYTPHTKPQVQIKSDEFLGACQPTNNFQTCDYEFQELQSKIEFASLDPIVGGVEDSYTLIIKGTNIGQGFDQFENIGLGKQGIGKCKQPESSLSDGEIVCHLEQPTAGKFYPIIETELGFVPIDDASVTELEINPIITGSDLSSLKVRGRQRVKIEGKGFPLPGTQNQIQILIGGQRCRRIKYISYNEIECRTPNLSDISETKADLKIVINGSNTIMNDFFDIEPPENIVAIISPDKVLGSEKQNLVITMTGFKVNLSSIEQFEIILKKKSTQKEIRMRAFSQSYSSNENIITVRYPGADAGQYSVEISYDSIGFICFTQNEVKVGALIYSIQPKQGSIYGGTQLTITGERFHTTQTKVVIGENQCEISSITSNQIKCLTPESPKRDFNTNQIVEQSTDVLVVINLIEQALPTTSEYQFYWKQDLSLKVTNVEYDSGTNMIVISSDNFGNHSKEDIQVNLSGYEQSVESFSSSQIRARLTEIATKDPEKPLELKLRFKGAGYANIPKQKSNLPLPNLLKLNSISPGTNISQGGQDLIISGDGFPVDMQGKIQGISVSDIICNSIIYVSMTQLKCTSLEGNFNAQGLKLINTLQQINADCNDCTFITASNSPIVTSLIDNSYSGDKQIIQIVGSDFSMNSVSIQLVEFQNEIQADEFSIVSDTQISAKFSGGIGYGENLKLSTLKFSDGSYAKIYSTAIIDRPLQPASISENLECSFFGGCKWQIRAKDINVSQSLYNIQICGQKCLQEPNSNSNNDLLVCLAPKMETVFAIQKYSDSLLESKSLVKFNTKDREIVQPYSLYLKNNGSQKFAFDQDYSTAASNYATEFGLQIIDGIHVFTVEKVRYFLRSSVQTKDYIGGVFQVSGDGGNNWQKIGTIKDTPVYGWNDVQVQIQGFRTYNKIRFILAKTIQFTELQIIGKVVAIDDQIGDPLTNNNLECKAQVRRGSELIYTKESSVIYKVESTAIVTNIQPRLITALGGDEVTISLQNFFTIPQNQIEITINHVPCIISDVQMILNDVSSIKCISGKRSSPSNEIIKIQLGTHGQVVLSKGVSVDYILNWSDPQAWSGQYPPADGDSISIPQGQNLVFDLDESPKLKAVVVEGSLFFYPKQGDLNHVREFHSEYIVIRSGLLQAGTETQPYNSKLIFTMHGNRNSIELPIFGNNVLAVANGGKLELHGKEKTPTWIELKQTLQIGTTSLALKFDNSKNDFNWDIGDKILITTTSFNTFQNEEVVISSISNDSDDNPVLQFSPALKYKHYAAKETLSNGEILQMRAEVGLLSHSIKFQGDQNSIRTQYGAHMMFYSSNQPLSAKISNVEFYGTGQAMKKDRSPCNFYKLGKIEGSYLRDSSIHRAFQSAFILNEVSHLEISGLVGYKINGHGFSMSTGTQTYNQILNNLFVENYKSYFYVSEVTPSLFWIRNPKNNFIGNRAVGSLQHGFWFDLETSSLKKNGGTCPRGEALIAFRENVAHSNQGSGLHIYDEYIPRVSPCQPQKRTLQSLQTLVDQDPQDYVYGQNPAIPAQFINFKSFKNIEYGIFAQRVGSVSFTNIVLADITSIAFQVKQPGHSKLKQGFLDGAIIVGKSLNQQNLNDQAIGIRTGQSDSFNYKNAHFHNFQGQKSFAILTGNHNRGYAWGDGEGNINTHSFEGLQFQKVNTRLKYSTSLDQILHDLDGSLSGLNKQYWITSFQPHLNITSDCFQDNILISSIICQTPIRKVLFSYYTTSNTFYPPYSPTYPRLMLLSPEQFAKSDQNTSKINYPQFSWTFWLNYNGGYWFYYRTWIYLRSQIPFVIGNSYQIQWNQNDNDKLNLYRDRQYERDEQGFKLRFKYTSRKDEVHVFSYPGRQPIANITDPNIQVDYTSNSQRYGSHKQDVSQKIYDILVNSNKYDAGLGQQSRIQIAVLKCRGPCEPPKPKPDPIPDPEPDPKPDPKPDPQPDPQPDPNRTRYWSKPQDWDSFGHVPVEGDVATIKKEWNMIYDIIDQNSVNLQRVLIHGKLFFENEDEDQKHYALKSHSIVIDTGSLQIGQIDQPYRHKASILLLGESNDKTAYVDASGKNFGSKLFYISGKLFINGKKENDPTKIQSKLLSKASPNSKSLFVEPNLNWKVGSLIVIASTNYDPNYTQKKEILNYNNDTGEIELTQELEHHHYGASDKETYDPSFEYDLRAEVGYLSSDIIIQGVQSDSDPINWGGYILITSIPSSQPNVYLKNVEINWMGQNNENGGSKKGIKILNSSSNQIKIQDCSLHDFFESPLDVYRSEKVQILRNVIYNAKNYGVKISASNSLIQKNFFINVQGQYKLNLCKDCLNTKVEQNSFIGIGSIHFKNIDCKISNPWFNNNIIHSSKYGIKLQSNNEHECGILQNIVMHHIEVQAIEMLLNLKSFIVKNVVLVDNGLGLNLGLANGDTTEGEIRIQDSLIIGEHKQSRDCTEDFEKAPQSKKLMMYTSLGIRSKYDDFKENTDVDATRGKVTHINNVVFKDFPASIQRCNQNGITSAIHTHPAASDLVMLHDFNNIFLDNIQPNSLAYLIDSPSQWVNDNDCGEFECTGPRNILLRINSASVSDGSDYDLKKLGFKVPFDIISRNEGVSQGIGSCKLVKQMNSYQCNGDSTRGLLQFESLDSDRRDRYISPVIVKIEGLPNSAFFENKLNSFMDHTNTKNGKQKRFQRFISLVPTNIDQILELEFATTQPKSMLFELHGAKSRDEFVKIRIKYERPETVRIKKNGIQFPPNQLFRGTSRPLSGDVCGENRWDAQQNILQFTLQSDPENCSLKLITKPSVQLKFRIQYNIQKFYEDDGEAKFINRLSTALNIQRQRIRVVGVTQGSVIIKTEIVSQQKKQPQDNEGEEKQKQQGEEDEDIQSGEEAEYDLSEIKELNQKLKTMATNQQEILEDWKILNLSTSVRDNNDADDEEDSQPFVLIQEPTQPIQSQTQQEDKKSPLVLILILVGAGVFIIGVILTIVCIVVRRKRNQRNHRFQQTSDVKPSLQIRTKSEQIKEETNDFNTCQAVVPDMGTVDVSEIRIQ